MQSQNSDVEKYCLLLHIFLIYYVSSCLVSDIHVQYFSSQFCQHSVTVLLSVCVFTSPPAGLQWWHSADHSDSHQRWRWPAWKQESQQHGQVFLYPGKNLKQTAVDHMDYVYILVLGQRRTDSWQYDQGTYFWKSKTVSWSIDLDALAADML